MGEKHSVKKPMIIFSIIASIILLTTLIIQYGESEISEHNKELFIRQGRVNNDALLLNNYYQIYNQLTLYDLMDANLTFYPSVNVTKYMREELQDIYNENIKGNITDKELYRQVKDIVWAEIETKHNEYITNHLKAEDLYYNDSVWNGYVPILSVFQGVLIVSSIMGYMLVYYYEDKEKPESIEPRHKRGKKGKK